MSKKIICLIGIAGIMAITACNKGTAPSAANIGNGPTGVNDVIEARMSETEEEVDYFSDYSEDTEADGTSDDTTPTTGTPAEGVDVDLGAQHFLDLVGHSVLDALDDNNILNLH